MYQLLQWISIAYSRVRVCSLSYAECKAHAPCCTVICGVSGCTIFVHIISTNVKVFETKIIEHKMCTIYFV
jgi:hypothetical protein